MITFFVVFLINQAQAAERMIAYGYANCVACHVNPQGRNLLTEYGNSIDEAQSLRGAEYNESMGLFKLGGKLNQIVRGYISHVDNRRDRAATASTSFHFLNYQAALAVTQTFTVAAGADFREPSEAPSAVTPYYTAPERNVWFLDYAFGKFMASDHLAIVIGKDQLPTGINNADQNMFIHSRNSLGNNERPLQAKAFLWTERSMIAPYIYQPNGEEAAQMGERGFGLLAESDLYNKHFVVGINVLSGTSDTVDRKLAGLYTRMGLTQKIGFLAEFDTTWREIKALSASHRQQTLLAQMFYTPLEWVVWSVGYEYLDVTDVFDESGRAYSGKLALRLNRNFTVSASVRHAEKANLDSEVSQLALFAKF